MTGQLLSINAECYPDATALVFEDRRFTFSQLNARACQAAQALRALGIGRGARVAALLANCNEFVELFFATAKIGAVFVPINFRLAAPEVGRVLDGCTPAMLVAGAEFTGVLCALADVPSLPRRVVLVGDRGAGSGPMAQGPDYEQWIGAQAAVEPDTLVAMTDDALIVHSSGTTGVPKGALWTHFTTFASCSAKIIDFQLTRDDATVVFGPLFHAGPLMDLAVPVLLRGGKLVLGRSRGFDPAQLLEVVARERATVVTVYPTMWKRVLAEADPARYDLGRLRALFTGGEPTPRPVLQAIYERFAGAAFVNTWGSTEAGPITTFLAPADRVAKMGSVGKPAFGVQVRVVDEAGGALTAEAVGEVVVRSPFTCKGYWNRPDLTAGALREGWWHTGDLGYLDSEGFLWLCGRMDDMIISGAENIYPVEVEQAIGALEAVDEVGVVGVPDAHWGESVAAFVVRRAGAALETEDVVEHCRRVLAGYKKPRHVLFIDRLPRTTTNKIARESLRRRWADARGEGRP